MVAETAENAATVATATARHSQPPHVWQIDREALAHLADLGRDVPDDEVTKRRAALTPDTAATICYTSGTTGRPKGCVLTHANLHAEAANTVELLHPIFKEITGQVASTLLFLPLAHILGRTIQIACLMARIEIGHCPSIKPDELRPALKRFRPTFLVGVPYLFERIHATGRATAERIGRGASFDRAHRIGVRFAAPTSTSSWTGAPARPPASTPPGPCTTCWSTAASAGNWAAACATPSAAAPRSTATSTSSSTPPGSSSTRATASPRPPRPPPSSRP